MQVSERIVETSLIISLLVFGLRVLLKEARSVFGDAFELIEFAIRWWIYIKGLVVDLSPVAVAGQRQPPPAPDQAALPAAQVAALAE